MALTQEEKAIIEDIVLVIQNSNGLKANQIPKLIGQKKIREANIGNLSRLLKAERAGRIKWDYAKKLWVGC